MKARLIAGLLAGLCVMPNVHAAEDPICRQLWDSYLARSFKVNTATKNAAIHIVSERGRGSGFWQVVLAELKKEDQQSEINCVTVLGKMLATDAAARYLIWRQKEFGEISAWMASVVLPKGVVGYLIERGRQADRFRVNHYAAALLRANVPETLDFFRTILRNNTGKNYMKGTQFYAAAALAQQNDHQGFAWLVANSGDSLPTVSGAWPIGSSSRNLDSCCLAALQQLTDRRQLATPAQWKAWWANERDDVKRKLRPIRLGSGRW